MIDFLYDFVYNPIDPNLFNLLFIVIPITIIIMVIMYFLTKNKNYKKECKFKKNCFFWNKDIESCSKSICKYGLDNRKLPKKKKKESWIKKQFKESWNTAKNILFGYD